jgi:hypothetical protein
MRRRKQAEGRRQKPEIRCHQSGVRTHITVTKTQKLEVREEEAMSKSEG